MKRLFPCGNTRREFVWQMGGGFAGLALSSLLDSDGFFARHGLGKEKSDSPLAPKSALCGASKELHFLDDEWCSQPGRHVRL